MTNVRTACFARFSVVHAGFLLALVGGSGLTSHVSAQSAQGGTAAVLQASTQETQLPLFSVVSVRPMKTTLTTAKYTAEGYLGSGVTLRRLLIEAYGIQREYLIGEPQWSQDNMYAIEAKVDPTDTKALQELTFKQRSAMLQQILKERFALKAHYADVEQSVYALTLAKGGSLLERYRSGASATASSVLKSMGPGHIRVENTTISSFAGELSHLLDRPVLDKTELTGRYDLALAWAPEDSRGSMSSGSTSGFAQAPNDLPHIFTAIQDQLGLKLQPTKGNVRCLIIDHIELPSAN